jgi:hypothetical protein
VIFDMIVRIYVYPSAKVVKKSHMRKGYAIFSCKV